MTIHVFNSLGGNRREESRDAARMCLRLPLATIGLDYDEFRQVAVLGEIAEESDPIDAALEKLAEFHAKLREAEQDDDQGQKTPVQAALEEAGLLIDEAVMSKTPFGEVREAVGEKLRSVGRNDFATFVDGKTA